MPRAPKPSEIAAWPADSVSRWPLASLIPYARNARAHSDAQVAQIAASIRQWGWTVPVLVEPDGTLIAGHGRVLAAERLSLETIPAMVADGWSAAQIAAYRIADNKLTLNGAWDDELLRIELLELKDDGFDLDLTGFDSAEIVDLFGGDPTAPDVAGANAYREQYGVIVLCRDEAHQRAVFERLRGDGMDVKVVAT